MVPNVFPHHRRPAAPQHGAAPALGIETRRLHSHHGTAPQRDEVPIIGFEKDDGSVAEPANVQATRQLADVSSLVSHASAPLLSRWRPIGTKFARLAKRFTPGEWLRLGVAAGMLGLLIWSIDPGVLFPSSLTAQINAPLLTLRAPIDGRVEFVDGQIGDQVERGAVLMRMQNEREGGTHLADLTAQRQAAADRANVLRHRIAELQSFDKRLDAETAAFASATIDRLAAEIAEATAQQSKAASVLENAKAQLQRTETLTGSGFATQAQLDDRRAAAKQAANDLEARKSQLTRLQKERGAAEQGIFIGDTYNNTPYSQQRRDELRIETMSLSAQLAETEIQGRLLDAQIAAERKVPAVVAPGAGILWRVDVAAGEFVKSGTPLAQVADCDRLFMMLPSGSRSLDRLEVGEPVDVVARGTPRALPGHIAALRAGGDSEIAETAVNLLANEKEQFRWIVTLDAGPQTGNLSAACPIGATAALSPASSFGLIPTAAARGQRRIIRSQDDSAK